MNQNYNIECPDGPCTGCKVNRVRWNLRQLLPLTYRTKYKTQDGKTHFSVWRMWFGKVFNHEEVTISA